MLSASGPGRPARVCEDIEAADRSFDILLRDVTRLIEAGVFRAVDPCCAAEALWACLHGTTAIILDHADHLDTDPGLLAGTVLDIAVQGLRRVAPATD